MNKQKLIPLFLEEEAFAVYEHMAEEEKKDACEIERTLLGTFAIYQFSVYDALRKSDCWPYPGESIDGY